MVVHVEVYMIRETGVWQELANQTKGMSLYFWTDYRFGFQRVGRLGTLQTRTNNCIDVAISSSSLRPPSLVF